MNYRNAAGRNWARQPSRHRRVNLDPRGAASPPAPTSWRWRIVGEYRKAPGRNWARDERARRRAQLEPSERGAEVGAGGPAREPGGGDHDQPYYYHAPSSERTIPFSTREYARLLLLKSRLRAERAFDHRWGGEPSVRAHPDELTAEGA
jgi:hypothetical protein